jgi:hypothetical protein
MDAAISPQVAIDLWRARFGVRWTPLGASYEIQFDPFWQEITLVMLDMRALSFVETVSKQLRIVLRYKLKESYGNS